MKSKLIRSLMGLVTLTVGMTTMTAFADIYSDAGRVRRVDDAVGGMTLYGQPSPPPGLIAPPLPPPPPSNAYGKSWTSYFLGQSKGNGDDNYVINYDGTVTNVLYYGHYLSLPGYPTYDTPPLVRTAVTPLGTTPVTFDGVTGCSNGSGFATIEVRPLFTTAAKLNGSPPYDWEFVVSPNQPTAPYCSG